MANFIGLVYATLKEEGIDTSGMSTDEAVAKFKELQKKDGGSEGEKEGTPAEQKKVAEMTETKTETPKEKDVVEQARQEEIDNNGKKSEEIDYENINYPKGTSKEYTQNVNSKYEQAIPILEKAGIKLSDFKGKKNSLGGMDDNTQEIAEKYVFEPFKKKYPNGNNDAWNKEFQPLFDAIMAVEDKNYNDFYIKNNQ